MLTFFIHFGLSFRQADHWLASRLFGPSPPPPPPPPPPSSYHFFNGPFLINNSLVSGRRFQTNSGYFKNGPLEPGPFEGEA